MLPVAPTSTPGRAAGVAIGRRMPHRAILTLGAAGYCPRALPPLLNCASDPNRPANFQDLIPVLQRFWADQGRILLQPYDVEVGAGTFHPATTLRALGPEAWRAVYVQLSRARPTVATART